MPHSLDPKRTVAELKELRALTGDEHGAQRVAFTPTMGRRAPVVPAGSSPRCPASRSTPMPPGTCGPRCPALRPNAPCSSAGTSIPYPTAGGSTAASTSSPDWKSSAACTRNTTAVRPSPCGSWTGPTRKARVSARACSARRRARATSTWTRRAPCATATACACPTRCANSASTSSASRTAAGNSPTPPPTSNCTSNRAPCCSTSACRWARCSGTFGVERHAMTFHGQAAHSGSTPMNRRKDAFLAAAQMARRFIAIAERHGGRLHDWFVHDEAGHRHQRRRGMPDHARPAASRRGGAGATCCGTRSEASERFARGGRRHGAMGADLEHRAAPLSSRVAGALRRGHRGGRRAGAPVAVGAAARRRRGGAVRACRRR